MGFLWGWAFSHERGTPVLHVHREHLSSKFRRQNLKEKAFLWIKIGGKFTCFEALKNTGACEDWVLDGPASGGKGSKGRNQLDCIRGKRRKGSYPPGGTLSINHHRLERPA